MRMMNDRVMTGLEWEQPSAWHMEYRLRSGEEETATLKFRSAWGSLATAESGNDCWTFKRVGFLQTRVSIRACGDETDLASFRNNTWSGGGTLEFPDGRAFRATTNLWQTRLEWQSTEAVPLVYFHTGGVIRRSAQVEVEPHGSTLAELPLLIVLGWYLAVMMYKDASIG
jgi:hypothetical protein